MKIHTGVTSELSVLHCTFSHSFGVYALPGMCALSGVYVLPGMCALSSVYAAISKKLSSRQFVR